MLSRHGEEAMEGMELNCLYWVGGRESNCGEKCGGSWVVCRIIAEETDEKDKMIIAW